MQSTNYKAPASAFKRIEVECSWSFLSCSTKIVLNPKCSKGHMRLGQNLPFLLDGYHRFTKIPGPTATSGCAAFVEVKAATKWTTRCVRLCSSLSARVAAAYAHATPRWVWITRLQPPKSNEKQKSMVYLEVFGTCWMSFQVDIGTTSQVIVASAWLCSSFQTASWVSKGAASDPLVFTGIRWMCWLRIKRKLWPVRQIN